MVRDVPTGGQMTAATTVGQRTKTSLDGRSEQEHGYPIPVADIVASFPGAAYVAHAARSTSPTPSRRTRRYLARGVRVRSSRARGSSLVEILTMCPTGWAVPTDQGAQYQRDQVESTFGLGELRPRSRTT